MVIISNFTWEMRINLEVICYMIEHKEYRKQHYSIKQFRRIYKLICRYGSEEDIHQALMILNMYPLAFKELTR